MSKKPRVKLSMNMAPDTNRLIDEFCDENSMTKTDLFRKGVVLAMMAINHQKKGNHLVVMDSSNNRLGEIVGI